MQPKVRGKRDKLAKYSFYQSLWYYLGAYILSRGWCCGPVEDGNSTVAPAQSPVKATSGKAGLSMQKARVHHNFHSNFNASQCQDRSDADPDGRVDHSPCKSTVQELSIWIAHRISDGRLRVSDWGVPC